MPAVAQINVNFANRLEFTERIPNSGVTSVKAVSPYTLLQYLMYNRENVDLGPIPSPVDAFLNYTGGFISAGDKVNVKHSDFQIRPNDAGQGGNLDVEKNIYSDYVFSRRKGDTNDTYQLGRTTIDRSVTIAPFENNTSDNFIKLFSSGSSKILTILNKDVNSKENSIVVESSSDSREIKLTTNNCSLKAGFVTIQPESNDVCNVNIDGETVFQRNMTMVGSDVKGAQKFTIKSSTNSETGATVFYVDSYDGYTYIKGNTDIMGDATVQSSVTVNKTLRIDGSSNFNDSMNLNGSAVNGAKLFTINNGAGINNFQVDSATGNTVIQGTLTVKNFSTHSNYINFDAGDSNAESRRITGLRRFTSGIQGVNEFSQNTNFDNDALSVGDFKRFTFVPGMIMMWSGSIARDQNNVLLTPANGWALCDGTTATFNGASVVTPDLRSRFIVGAGPNAYNLNDRDGLDKVTLSVAQMPAHNHSQAGNSTTNDTVQSDGSTNNAGSHTHSYTKTGSTGNFRAQEDSGSQQWNNTGSSENTGSGGSHAHTVDTSFTMYARGGGQEHENRPPFHALYFIIKL